MVLQAGFNLCSGCYNSILPVLLEAPSDLSGKCSCLLSTVVFSVSLWSRHLLAIDLLVSDEIHEVLPSAIVGPFLSSIC